MGLSKFFKKREKEKEPENPDPLEHYANTGVLPFGNHLYTNGQGDALGIEFPLSNTASNYPRMNLGIVPPVLLGNQDNSVPAASNINAITAPGGDVVDPQFVVVTYLYDICNGNGWFKLMDPLEPCVVKLNNKKGNKVKYRYLPACDEIAPNSFVDCCGRFLRAEAAIRISFPVVHLILDMFENKSVVSLDDDCNIQVISTISELQWVRKHQNCSFVKDEKCLVVWADSVDEVIEFAHALEDKMVEWRKGNESVTKKGEYVPRVTFASIFSESTDSSLSRVEIIGDNVVTQVTENGSVDEKKEDLENQYGERPVRFIFAFLQAISVMMVFTWIGLQMAALTKSIRAEGNYLILLIIIYQVPFILFTSFFASAVANSIFYLIGPVSQLSKNSYAYSAKKVTRLRAANGTLPHVTIQCPVFKERLDTVIKPTVRSLQIAVRTYELQGGSANIFINDDGLQIIPEEEALERMEYYELCGIGYVSRPPDGENGFKRKGRFKKASNMNYCLNISTMVDKVFYEKLAEKEKWSPKEQSATYLKCLENIAKEEGKCWAGGDILLGEFILLVDSDTRVPEDCLVDSVSEMMESPSVAIIQHASGVMMVVNNYWEKMIAWFTDLINFCISTSAGNGLTMAPFVGHNAFLRWSAMQELAYLDEDDGVTKYWSETHVSEDFEMSLQLSNLGYTIRNATYHDSKFLEGVSLTVYDEITRWSKYAYGCAEIMFTPFKRWWTGKIFTGLFIQFLRSNLSLACKFSILAYMGTYFAIAASLIMLLANYFIVGYYSWGYVRVYIDSMQIFVSVMVVFGVANQVSYIVGRYRVNRQNLFEMILQFRWSLLFTIFMAGLSWHMVVAIAYYFFSINLQWGSTAKDIDDSNFFKEVPKAFKNYMFMYIFCIICIAGMIVLAVGVPYAFQIKFITCALPLGWTIASHFLTPIILNPQLMSLNW